MLAKTNASNGTLSPDDSIKPTTISGSSRRLKATKYSISMWIGHCVCHAHQTDT